MKSLVWLRADLRLEDNPALKKACLKHEVVQAVYIFSKNQLTSHNEANVKIDFIVKNLFLLEKSLSELNIPLTILQSDGFNEDPKLVQDLSLKRKYEEKAIKELWEFCKARLIERKIDKIVLDEIGMAISLGFIEENDLISLLNNRPSSTDIILTGPSIPPKVIEMADQITELRCN